MTRDKFIDGYMQRSGISPSCRTETGFRLAEGIEQIAIPCDCGEKGCAGWAMVDPNSPGDRVGTMNAGGPDR